MNLLITVIVIFPILASANKATRCEQFFLTSTSIAISIQKKQISQVSISADELLNTNPQQLNDRAKALLAKVIDYMQSHEAQTARELVVLGLEEKEVVKIMIPIIQKDLTILESEGPTLQLFREPKKISGTSQKFKSSPKTLDDFSNEYDLDSARTTISTLIGYRFSLRDGVRPENILKAAMMTKDPGLINRALQQALKYGHFNELTAIAAEMKNNWVLIELGKLSLARYLSFERNGNWLADALRSFSEVTGSERELVEQMLYDLFDLIKASPGMNFEKEDLVNILIRTLPIVHRFRGDSSARFVYQYARTNDPKYVNRVKSLFDAVIARHERIGTLSDAINQIQDPDTLLQFAKTAEAYSQKVDQNWNQRDKDIFIGGAMSVAAEAIVMSENLKEIENYYQRVMTDKRFNSHNRPIGFAHGTNSLLAPKKIVELLRSYVSNPKLISENTTTADLLRLIKWFKHYDYIFENESQSVGAMSKIFYKVNFWHEENSIQSFLEKGDGATPEQVHNLKIEGEQKLKAGDYWWSMAAFIAARDLDGLERIYYAMLTRGRPLDAVYAANAMEWIRTGRSPFENEKAISKDDKHFLK